jgi:hypothetical protein
MTIDDVLASTTLEQFNPSLLMRSSLAQAQQADSRRCCSPKLACVCSCWKQAQPRVLTSSHDS